MCSLPLGSVVVVLLPSRTPALESTTCSSLALWITCMEWCPPCFTSSESVYDGLCAREPPFPLSLVTPKYTLGSRMDKMRKFKLPGTAVVGQGWPVMLMWRPEWVTVL